MTANRLAHLLLPTSEFPAQRAFLAGRTGSRLASSTRALLTKATWIGGYDG
jgi:hypothetical protein